MFQEALVLGSGVSGLTCAVRLREAGLPTRILTRDLPGETTSAVAAAIWHPYKADPPERVAAWSLASLKVFLELAREPRSGVVVRSLVELFEGSPPDPDWRLDAPGFRTLTRGELEALGAAGRYGAGYSFEAPVIETPIYLPYLLERFRSGGGVVEPVSGGIAALEPFLSRRRLVVCCVGLGARDLLGDREVFPIRGQVVRIENPGVPRALIDDAGPGFPTYVIPRSNDCILGGSADAGREDLAVDVVVEEGILARNRALEPRLAGARVLDRRVGLRPGRTAVRLEREERPEGPVIYNYGHGGAGYTLSWGCAAEVLALAGL
jgi:D-amino-acid oxidase